MKKSTSSSSPPQMHAQTNVWNVLKTTLKTSDSPAAFPLMSLTTWTNCTASKSINSTDTYTNNTSISTDTPSFKNVPTTKCSNSASRCCTKWKPDKKDKKLSSDCVAAKPSNYTVNCCLDCMDKDEIIQKQHDENLLLRFALQDLLNVIMQHDTKDIYEFVAAANPTHTSTPIPPTPTRPRRLAYESQESTSSSDMEVSVLTWDGSEGEYEDQEEPETFVCSKSVSGSVTESCSTLSSSYHQHCSKTRKYYNDESSPEDSHPPVEQPSEQKYSGISSKTKASIHRRVRNYITKIHGNEAKYSGPAIQTKNRTIPHGVGVVRFDNGDLYLGTLEYGILDGMGSLYRKDGTLLRGKFHNGILDGPGTNYLELRQQ